MKDWFNKYWWIPSLLIVAGLVWLYFYLRSPKNKISFNFMSQSNLGNLLSSIEGRYAQRGTDKGIGVYLDVPLTTVVNNKGAKEMILNNIAGSLSYQGESILQTKANSQPLQAVKVEAKGTTPVSDTFQVLINGASIKYFRELLGGKKPKLNYNLTAMVANKIYSFRDSTIINETNQPNQQIK